MVALTGANPIHRVLPVLHVAETVTAAFAMFAGISGGLYKKCTPEVAAAVSTARLCTPALLKAASRPSTFGL